MGKEGVLIAEMNRIIEIEEELYEWGMRAFGAEVGLGVEAQLDIEVNILIKQIVSLKSRQL